MQGIHPANTRMGASMPGLPFGAVQAHDVAAQYRTYEHITGIEFIEVNPDMPYPRSAAYRAVPQGGQMRIRDNAPEIDDIELAEDEARAFVEELAQSGLFEWQRVYRPAQGTFVVESVEWRVEVSFDVPVMGKRSTTFKVEGEGVFPDNYEQVISKLMRKQDAE